jgi:hypothetical protein
MEKSPFLIPVIILIAIVFTALIVSAIIVAPLHPVNFSQTNEVNQPNISKLNLNFQADVAEVNVIAQNLTGKTILINTSATGSTDIFGSTSPIRVTFSNETGGNTLTITSRVAEDQGLLTGALRVICNIYIDPSLDLNLNVTTETGQISLTANQHATFESLNIKSNTGMVQANIENGTTIAGDISLKTTTGAVWVRMNQANVRGNDTLNLQSTTGLVDMDIAENQTLSGNIQLNAATTTGAINLAMLINGDVGARIESQTQIGEITKNLNNFSGNESSLQSINYPAESNFRITLKTSVGGIEIKATYQSSATRS